jgi:hypothetical protein
MEENQQTQTGLTFSEIRSALQNIFSEVISGQALQIAALNKQIEVYLQTIQDMTIKEKGLIDHIQDLQVEIFELQRMDAIVEETEELSPGLAEIAGRGSAILDENAKERAASV